MAGRIFFLGGAHAGLRGAFLSRVRRFSGFYRYLWNTRQLLAYMSRRAIPAVFTLLLLLAGIVCRAQLPDRGPVFIRLDLPEAYPRYRNQWAYLYCMVGNDLTLVDSCFLKDDVRSVDFRFDAEALPEENRAFYERNVSEYRYWFTFAARGPIELFFYPCRAIPFVSRLRSHGMKGCWPTLSVQKPMITCTEV